MDYGDQAYEHAKPEFHGGENEDWTGRTAKIDRKTVDAKRFEEYSTRQAKIRQKIQTISELSEDQLDSEYEVAEGDTLFGIFTDEYGMNMKTALVACCNLLQRGVNVDHIKPGDTYMLSSDGSFTYNGKKYDNILKAVAVSAPATPRPGPAVTPPVTSPEPKPEDPAEKTEKEKVKTGAENIRGLKAILGDALVERGPNYFYTMQNGMRAVLDIAETAEKKDTVRILIRKAGPPERGNYYAMASDIDLSSIKNKAEFDEAVRTAERKKVKVDSRLFRWLEE